MAKKKIEETATEIRKHVEKGSVVFGQRETVRLLRQGKIEKVFLAVNCEKENLQDVMHLGKISNVPIVETTYPNDELGILCKRQHAVSVLGVARE